MPAENNPHRQPIEAQNRHRNRLRVVTDSRDDVLRMPTGQMRTIFDGIVGETPLQESLFDTGQYVLPAEDDISLDMDGEVEAFLKTIFQAGDPDPDSTDPDEQPYNSLLETGIQNKAKVDGAKRISNRTKKDEPEVKKHSPITSQQEKRLKKKMNKIAKMMQKKAEATAKQLDDAVQPVEEKKADGTKLRKSEYRMVDGKLIKTDYLKEKEANAWLYSRAKAAVDVVVPVVKQVVEKIPRDIAPEPLTALQRLTSITTTFIAGSVALVAPFSTGSEGKSAADAAKPSSRPAGIEAQVFNFGKEEAIPPQSEAKKDFVQEKRKLIYPPGINPEIWLPSVQLPESPELYRFMTLQDEGEDGVGKHDTPSEERFGNSDLIGTIYTTAQAYKAKYKNSQLLVADLTAPGHTSHDKNIDVDIYLPDGGLKIGSDKYDKNRAVELGIMLINSGKIELIIFNDDYVIERVNKYAEDNMLPGRMINEGKHNRHMHVRIKEKEVKINIPWMPEQVTRWNDLIIAKAKKYNVDPEFVSVIMYKESSGNPRAGSGVGAQGLMQIMPETAAGIARELGVKNYDIWDPETNIEFGTYYLSQLLKKYGRAEHSPSWDRSIILAAIGYNGGPGAADGYLSGRVTEGQGPFCESREYAYYVVGMWRERHEQASKHFDELNQIGHRCNKDAKSYPVASLK